MALAAAALAAGLPAQTNSSLLGLSPSQVLAPREGGDYSITVTADRPWSVVSAPPWVAITSALSGNDATLAIHVAANSESAGTGDNLGIRISQTGRSAGDGAAQLSPATLSVPLEGGSYSLTVTATGAWALSAADSWITFASAASGTGNGTVSIRVAANNGPSRGGRVNEAGGSFTEIQQAGVQDGGRLEVTPASIQVSETGGTGTLTIKSNLNWRALSGLDWVSTSPDHGTGDGTVTYTIGANPAPQARTGYINVDAPFKFVTIPIGQPGNGPTALDPPFIQAAKEGGTFTINVTATGGWTASTTDSWITITAGASGRGNGTVTLQVAPNTGSAIRNGAVSFGDRALFTAIAQQGTGGDHPPPTDSLTVTPNPVAVPAEGGQVTVQVRTKGDWTAVGESWTSPPGSGGQNESVAVSPASGRGDTQLTLVIPPNWTSTPVKRAALNINGRRIPEIQQPALNEVTVNPTEVHIPYKTSASGTIQVTSSGPWKASTRSPWLRLNSGAYGSGSGEVSWSVSADAFDGREKSAALDVNHRQVVFILENCVPNQFRVIPLQWMAQAGGGAFNVRVQVDGAACPWTATTDAAWLTVSPSSGAGTATVALRAQPNLEGGRQASVVVTRGGCGAGCSHTINVQQPLFCAVTVSPTSFNLGADGGADTVTIDAAGDCGWAAVSDVPWATWSGTSTGQGPGTVKLQVAANGSTKARYTTLHVGGQDIPVTQAGAPCAYTVAAPAGLLPAGGGSVRLSLRAPDQSCTWTAASSQSWATFAPANGFGNSAVTVTAAPNPDTNQRSAVISVGGKEAVLTQAGVTCLYSLSPASVEVPSARMGGIYGDVQVQTGPACTWTATTSDDWIRPYDRDRSPVPPSGSGGGTFHYDLDSNSRSLQPRVGTVRVGGAEFTVRQAGHRCQWTSASLLRSIRVYINSEGGQNDAGQLNPDNWDCPAPRLTHISCSWLTVDVPWSRTGGLVVLSAPRNTTGSARSCEIDLEEFHISGEQGASGSSSDPGFKYSLSTAFLHDLGSGGRQTVQIMPRASGVPAPRVIYSSDWVRLDPITASGGGWELGVTMLPFPGTPGSLAWRSGQVQIGPPSGCCAVVLNLKQKSQ